MIGGATSREGRRPKAMTFLDIGGQFCCDAKQSAAVAC